MAGKKKLTAAKSWALAGESVYPTPLAPAEERVFKESIASLRFAALQMWEDSPRSSSSSGAMRQGEHAAKASLEFFFRYFDGMYRREDIVEALAKAVALPAPTANHCNSSCCYMLGTALWFLDYVKQEELWEELIPLLPPELDDEVDFATPAVDDLAYSRDHMLGLMTVFMERKKKHRQAFRKIWGLVDRETSARLKGMFKDALLDYFDRYLKVHSRVKPHAGQVGDGAVPPLSSPAFCDPFGINTINSLQEFRICIHKRMKQW